MATEVLMPKLGLTMQSGTVTQWLKQTGDEVTRGEPLLEIESEKVSFTVEAPADGIVRIVVADGEEVPVATPVGYIGAADEAMPSAPTAQAPAAAASVDGPTPAPRRAAAAAESASGEYAVSPAARKLARDLGVDASQVRPARGSRVTTEDVEAFHQASKTAAARPAADVPVSPAARKLARELGVDLSQVRPAGRSRISTEDVQAFHDAQRGAGPARKEVAGGQPVGFFSDGVRLAGLLFVPGNMSAGERHPGVVLSTGIQGLKELGPLDLAQRLAEAGLVSLIYDYRGFGESEGERWRPLPHEQVRDLRAAVSFLAAQPQVDSRRIGALGISMGGAHTLSAAAVDERIRAVVAVEPVTDARRWLRGLRAEWEWRAFLDRIAQDRQARATSGSSQRVPIYEVMVPDPETRIVLDALAKMRPELELQPQLPLESAEAFLEYSPEATVDRIAPRPVLFLHGEMDVLVSPDESRSAAARAGSTAKLMVLPNMGHLNWQRPGHLVFAQVVDLAATWFKEHLSD